jgi:hypothetical protein
MTKADLKQKALELPPAERRKLAADLWESSLDEAPDQIPDWHWPLVEESLREHRRDPQSALPGKEVLNRLRKPPA